MSDPLERAVERGTQRRLLSEIANLRALLAQAEILEVDNERVIVGLNKQLTEQFELSTKYVGISEECRAALATARAEAAQWLEMSERHCRRQEAAEAEADAMREALDQTISWLRRNASAEQENKSRSAFIEAHNAMRH